MADRDISWESVYPYATAALIAGMVSRLSIKTPTVLNDHGISTSSFFANLLNVEFFAAGVMFSMFVFTMAPAAGFIAKLEKLGLYKRFRRYTLEAIALGILGSALCIPLASLNSTAMERGYFPLISVLAIAFAAGFLASVFRVVRIFLFWTKQV